MEAKYTILTPEQIDEFRGKGYHWSNVSPSLLEVQAEVSFQAGQEQARKEIIDRIEKSSNPMNTNMYGISLSKTQWEALKSGKIGG